MNHHDHMAVGRRWRKSGGSYVQIMTDVDDYLKSHFRSDPLPSESRHSRLTKRPSSLGSQHRTLILRAPSNLKLIHGVANCSSVLFGGQHARSPDTTLVPQIRPQTLLRALSPRGHPDARSSGQGSGSVRTQYSRA